MASTKPEKVDHQFTRFALGLKGDEDFGPDRTWVLNVGEELPLIHTTRACGSKTIV